MYKIAEDEAVQKLSAHVKDIQARTYRVPTNAPACQIEREATLQCYGANAQNPLLCASFVSAFEKCANTFRLEFLQRNGVSVDTN